MSLYNALFGVNPVAGIVLTALDLKPEQIPRFRDAYLDERDGQKVLAIYTRTGGGNRGYHESEERCRAENPEYFTGDNTPTGPWNSDLQALPGFIADEDDDFDSTYATFYYRVPESFAAIFTTLEEIGGDKTVKPGEKFAKLIDDLQSKEQTPETQRALEVGQSIFGQIEKAFAEGQPAAKP